MGAGEDAAPVVASPQANPYLAALLAFLVPGLGHLYLRRWWRGLAFLALVGAAIAIGVALDGQLWTVEAGKPLSWLATPGAMGIGAVYFVLRFGLGYHGTLTAAGTEYGSTFLITAGLMNILLILDSWDVARGHKS